MTEQKSIWVFIEHTDGVIADVSLELTGKARQLADRLGRSSAARHEVVGLLCGHDVDEMVQDVIATAPTASFWPTIPSWRSTGHSPTREWRSTEARKRQPEIFLIGGTPNGRDFAPRVASALRCGLTADCTDLQIGDYHVKKEDKTYKDLLYQIRPAFGGNLIATIVNPNTRPQMATVREGVMRKPAADAARQGVVEKVAPALRARRTSPWRYSAVRFGTSTVKLKDAPGHRRRRGGRHQQPRNSLCCATWPTCSAVRSEPRVQRSTRG